MSDEIEDFIRRAAERRKQQQGQRRPQPQRPAPLPQQPQKRQRAPLAQPISQQQQLVEAEIVPVEIVEHVSSHVSSHFDNQDFIERASHMGEQTALADDRLEARLHSKFDHRVGRLSKGSLNVVEDIPDPTPGTAVAYTPPVVSTGALVDMLRSQQSIRQAVIMNEILTRREWE